MHALIHHLHCSSGAMFFNKCRGPLHPECNVIIHGKKNSVGSAPGISFEDKSDRGHQAFINSDDFCDYERITITQVLEGKLEVHKVLRQQVRTSSSAVEAYYWNRVSNPANSDVSVRNLIRSSMGHTGDDYSQAPPIQGLLIKGRDSIFQALCINLLSFSQFQLSWAVFCAILFILKCNEALGGCLDELHFIIIAVIFLAHRMEGTNIYGVPIVLVRRVMQIATGQQLLLIGLFTFGLMISGAHANDQNEGLQISILSDPNAWETIEYILKAAAVTILAGLLIFVVVKYRPPQAIPEAARALSGAAQVAPESARAVLEAAPALPEVALALLIYPAVQGDDIDDVLKNAPVATRRNSPLESWL